MKHLIYLILEFAYWLQGKKTYLVTSAGSLLNLWLVLNPNALSSEQLLKIDGILVFLGGMALRAGISKPKF